MLGADVARQAPEVRKAYTEKVEDLIGFMTEELGCGREEAVLALIGVSGAISIANASSDPNFSREIIATTRRNLVELWKVRCEPKLKEQKAAAKARKPARRAAAAAQ